MSRRFLGIEAKQQPQKVYEKRRRTPSKYAEHIDDFKKVVVGSTKKLNNQVSLEEIPASENQVENKKDKQALTCKLPSGRAFSLNVVVTPHKKIIKERKPEQATLKEMLSPTQKEQKKSEQDLLGHFLKAYQELKDAIEQKNGTSEQDQQNNGSILKTHRKYSKIRRQKDEDQKISSYYDKILSLNQKYAMISQRIVPI